MENEEEKGHKREKITVEKKKRVWEGENGGDVKGKQRGKWVLLLES